MNRLNQTEPATFSILPCWAFFGDSYFLYFVGTMHRNEPVAETNVKKIYLTSTIVLIRL
jgi:hypothetical protein